MNEEVLHFDKEKLKKLINGANGKKIKIGYRNSSGVESIREITPGSEVKKDDNFTAWCHKDKQPKTFKVERIQGVEINGVYILNDNLKKDDRLAPPKDHP